MSHGIFIWCVIKMRFLVPLVMSGSDEINVSTEPLSVYVAIRLSTLQISHIMSTLLSSTSLLNIDKSVHCFLQICHNNSKTSICLLKTRSPITHHPNQFLF